MGYITSADCTLTNERTPESPRSNSCVTNPYSTFDIPAQPYPLIEAPKKPMSAIGLANSRGKRPARLHSSMMGTRFSSMNFRAVSRTRRSSSLSKVSKSIKSTPRNLMAGIGSHSTKLRNSKPFKLAEGKGCRQRTAGALVFDSWNPARHRRSVAVVFLSELPVQRGFLIEEYEEVDYDHYANQINGDVFGVKQPGLSRDNQSYSAVHGVSYEV